MKKTLPALILLFLFLTVGCEKAVKPIEKENLSETNIDNDESLIENSTEALVPAIKEIEEEPLSPAVPEELVDKFEPASVFENKDLWVGLVKGWALKQEIVDEETTDKAYEFIKDNYVLYINPNAKVTSGVKGGTFAELASRATGPKAVIKYFPGPPCGETVTVEVNDILERKDSFVGPDAHKDYEKVSCNIPNKNNVWYFSYFVNKGERYFNDKSKWNTESGEEGLFIATLTYEEENKILKSADFPIWDDEYLQIILKEASLITQNIKFGNFVIQEKSAEIKPDSEL